MKKTKLALSALVFLFACLFCSSAFAQADKTGMIVRGGVEVPIFVAASASIGEDAGIGALRAVGPGLDIAFGYRWQYFGLLLEQQIGAIISTDKAAKPRWKDGEDFIIEKNKATFLGATYFLMEEYIPIGTEFLITIGEGVGASYGSGKNLLYVTSTDAAFAIKVELGFTYFLFEQHGLGFNIEWAGALAFEDGFSLSYTVNPMLTYTAIF